MSARYADQTPSEGSHLERNAKRLNAVEINSSFYRPHRTSTYAKWAEATPAAFRFAVKLPKTITHEHRLKNCDRELLTFSDQVRGLGPKLALILVQLPPTLTFDQRIVEAFLIGLADFIPATVAIEPRHPDWFEAGVDLWLADHRAARVAADPPVVAADERPGGWSGLRYYRRHGSPRMYYSDYDAEALRALRNRLRDEEASGGAEIWCIFDNTASGAALGNALTITAPD